MVDESIGFQNWLIQCGCMNRRIEDSHRLKHSPFSNTRGNNSAKNSPSKNVIHTSSMTVELPSIRKKAPMYNKRYIDTNIPIHALQKRLYFIYRRKLLVAGTQKKRRTKEKRKIEKKPSTICFAYSQCVCQEMSHVCISPHSFTHTYTFHTYIQHEPIRRNSIFVKWLKSHFLFAISFIRGIILGWKKNINKNKEHKGKKRECIRYLCIQNSTWRKCRYTLKHIKHSITRSLDIYHFRWILVSAVCSFFHILYTLNCVRLADSIAMALSFQK